MKSEQYDIAIIGSGLSAYTALIFLIERKINLYKKICIITGENSLNKNFLDNYKFNYLKKYHKVIFERGNFHEIENDFLEYAIKNKNNLIYLKNFGGLGKYWGGGFFPDQEFDKNNKIQKFINQNFKVLKYTKNNYFEINNKNKKFVESLKSNFLVNPDNINELLNPGFEIEKLCKIHNIDIFRESPLDLISLGRNKIFNLDLKSQRITSKYILMGAGAIGSPKILYNSNFLKNESIVIKDHLLYRIPLLRIKRILTLFFHSKFKSNNNFFISSLRQAYKINIIQRNLFLGLYILDTKKIKVNKLLRFLIENEILIFSQIYVGSGFGEYSYKINLDFKNQKENNVSDVSLSIKEWKEIFLFFLSNLILPIPYKYKTQFGSSYHMYGTLIDEIHKLNIPSDYKNNIFVIDSSLIEKIDAEPTSYKLIKNTIQKMENFINLLDIKNTH